MSIIIVTHTFTHGPQHALVKFLKKRSMPHVVLVSHPLPHFGTTFRSTAKIYENGKFARKIEFPHLAGPEILLFFNDVVATLFFILTIRKRFLIFIGADSLNAAVGLLLRKMRLVRVVIYYCHSYRRIRFVNPLKNFIYHALDCLCIRSSDFVWNLSKRLTEIRKSQGLPDEKNIYTPMVSDFKNIVRLPPNLVNRKSLVYLGLLVPINGVELIIEAFTKVVSVVPEANLTIIGGGPLEQKLKQMVREKALENCVRFLGYQSHKKALKLIPKFGVGLAPYAPLPESTVWTTDPAKPKDYMACGLPVIMTEVGETAIEIKENSAGIVINYDSDELAEAIVKLFMDDNLFFRCKSNAVKVASMYDLETVFSNIWRKTLCNAKKKLGNNRELQILALCIFRNA